MSSLEILGPLAVPWLWFRLKWCYVRLPLVTADSYQVTMVPTMLSLPAQFNYFWIHLSDWDSLLCCVWFFWCISHNVSCQYERQYTERQKYTEICSSGSTLNVLLLSCWMWRSLVKPLDRPCCALHLGNVRCCKLMQQVWSLVVLDRNQNKLRQVAMFCVM